MSGAGGATPVLDSITLAYLPQNSPPVVRSISVISQAALTSQSAKSGRVSSAAYSVTVSGDTADTSGATTSAGTPTQTLTRAASQQITVSWQADDPDGDRLVYNLYFRAEDETQWMLLRAGTHDTSMTFDADILADGKYYFRVVASDRESNPPASAREAHADQHAGDDRQHAARHRHGRGALRRRAPRTWNGKRWTPFRACAAASTRSTPAIGCPWRPWTA
jgi:hypothetical protein